MKSIGRTGGRAAMVGDMLFSVITIPLALSYVEETLGHASDDAVRTAVESADLQKTCANLAIALFVMGVARLFRAFRLRGSSRLDFYRFLSYGAILLATSVSLLLDAGIVRYACLAYYATLLSDRVIAIVQKPKARVIALNVVLILLIVYLCLATIVSPVSTFVAMMIAAAHALLGVMAVAFARINLRVLIDVIRRTYAMEVILGLLLLIVSFSYVLKFLEPNTPTLRDALWYCVAIVTTIGFGDIAAVSTEGRILSVILGMYGIVVVALITSIIVNFYGEMKKEGEGKEDGQ